MTIIDPIEVGFWAPKSIDGMLLSELLMNFVLGDFRRPNVRKFIDPKWDPRERAIVLRYVANEKFKSTRYLGYSECRLCSKHDNGSADFTDGLYIWPEGLAHYIAEHRVRPPTEFVMHVLKRSR